MTDADTTVLEVETLVPNYGPVPVAVKIRMNIVPRLYVKIIVVTDMEKAIVSGNIHYMAAENKDAIGSNVDVDSVKGVQGTDAVVQEDIGEDVDKITIIEIVHSINNGFGVEQRLIFGDEKWKKTYRISNNSRRYPLSRSSKYRYSRR